MIEQKLKKLVKNWDKIPDEFKSNLKPNNYSQQIGNLKMEEHFVILLLDRQKPSVAASYDFDEERIGITKTGKIVWGFDSGCSCPSPWDDSYPGCYEVSKDWKEFEVKLSDFDVDVIKEIEEKIAVIESKLLIPRSNS